MSKIELGKIVNTIGLKGSLKVLFNYNVKKEVLNQIKNLQIEEFSENFIVEKLFNNKTFFVLKLLNYNSVNSVEKFNKKKIFIDEDSVNLTENNYFTNSLIGCEIVSQQGKFYGKIVGVENYGATDILFLQNQKEEFSVPFIKEVFVSFDITKKQIIASKKIEEVIVWKLMFWQYFQKCFQHLITAFCLVLKAIIT